MKSQDKKNKRLLAVVGPTSSGKTKIAVKLAAQFGGEIISADSRQVYKGMDIGTGKDLAEYAINKGARTVRIPYHLIDVVSPKTEFNLAKFYKKAAKAAAGILDRNKLPIIAGGTGLYAQALISGYELSPAKADADLRAQLEKQGVERLYERLKKIDPAFAEKLHESDQKNKRRIIRYIEIRESDQPSWAKNKSDLKLQNDYKYLILGITWPREVLCERIYKRLVERLEKEDMIGEVERLHYGRKVSWRRLENFGLEYKFISLYLRGELGYETMVEQLNIAIRQYAKRQMSWYRRWERQGAKINWIGDYRSAARSVRNFLDE